MAQPQRVKFYPGDGTDDHEGRGVLTMPIDRAGPRLLAAMKEIQKWARRYQKEQLDTRLNDIDALATAAIAEAEASEIVGYMIEASVYQRLKAIERRLYDDRPLSGDQRRDLANTMNALLGGAFPVREGDQT